MYKVEIVTKYVNFPFRWVGFFNSTDKLNSGLCIQCYTEAT